MKDQSALALSPEEQIAINLIFDATDVGSDQDNSVAGIGGRVHRAAKDDLDELYAEVGEEPASKARMMQELTFSERSALAAIQKVFDAARKDVGFQPLNDAQEYALNLTWRRRVQHKRALLMLAQRFREEEDSGKE